MSSRTQPRCLCRRYWPPRRSLMPLETKSPSSLALQKVYPCMIRCRSWPRYSHKASPGSWVRTAQVLSTLLAVDWESVPTSLLLQVLSVSPKSPVVPAHRTSCSGAHSLNRPLIEHHILLRLSSFRHRVTVWHPKLRSLLLVQAHRSIPRPRPRRRLLPGHSNGRGARFLHARRQDDGGDSGR